MKIYIYGLFCPVEKTIKYVGKSKNLKKRYQQHIRKLDKQFTPKRKWLESLFEKKLLPILKILDESENEIDARKLEQFYCNENKNTILNIHNPEKGAKSNVWKSKT
jgi:predicted GIY-YIG superfamily endonuclease